LNVSGFKPLLKILEVWVEPLVLPLNEAEEEQFGSENGNTSFGDES